ncbi:hypothetical protein F4776DRAFT_274254 [Hypoxylon sp. NC0597]|nr:hypothetical protein F4776DRAFT_274254 [Hypoxylon sp. NC0597]
MQEAYQINHTPNRRRQGGRHRGTPKTTYASESDIPTHKLNEIKNLSPTTPSFETLQPLRANSTSQKPRGNKKKNKKTSAIKDVVAPQNQNNVDRKSPSLQPKDTSGPIFAGSTFHASPAPSALPIPSFLNRSETDSPGVKAASSPEQTLSCPTTDSDEASPSSPPSVSRADGSPLDLLFDALRAEKGQARIRRASSVDEDASNLSPLSPPQKSHGSPKQFSPSPRAPASSQTRRSNNPRRPTTIGISPDELDGNPGQPVGPAFSTPYHERMRAARLNRTSAQSTPKVLQNQNLNSSDSLKRYLFTGRVRRDDAGAQQIMTPPNQIFQHNYQEYSSQLHKRSGQPDPAQHHPPHHRLPRGMFPASVLTANAQSSPSLAPPVEAQLTPYQPDQISLMEDSLRRMLKLDSPGQSLSLH